jgi:pimeloyl-ACP methyl ester carboxylesterase
MAPDAFGARLPAAARYAVLTHPLIAPLIMRPWFDRLALPLISRWFFPLSRAWAAAAACQGDVACFLDEAYGGKARRSAPGTRARKFVGAVEARQRDYEAAERHWRQVLFDSGGTANDETLIAAQVSRRVAAQAFMATRASALPLHMARPFAWVRLEIAPPRDVEAAHGARLTDDGAAFPVPPRAPVSVSHPVPSQAGRDRWLQFPSPVLGDTAWARVTEPADGGAKAPSLIFLHGIAMETEFWSGLVDPSLPLAQRGIRLIRPEGPWHGRRRPLGWFGGEFAMGRGPLGFMELFQAWVAEVAALIAWARATGGGPVAVGGVSLGALTAQMVAAAARHWPKEARPDALLLIAPSGDMIDVAQSGSLSRALDIPGAMQRAGWSAGALARWAPLLQPPNGPDGEPGLDPARIVMVLGEADDLVPYPGGLALARSWGIPKDNLFQRPQGHFSVSLGLEAAPQPLDRLAKLLESA